MGYRCALLFVSLLIVRNVQSAIVRPTARFRTLQENIVQMTQATEIDPVSQLALVSDGYQIISFSLNDKNNSGQVVASKEILSQFNSVLNVKARGQGEDARIYILRENSLKVYKVSSTKEGQYSTSEVFSIYLPKTDYYSMWAPKSLSDQYVFVGIARGLLKVDTSMGNLMGKNRLGLARFGSYSFKTFFIQELNEDSLIYAGTSSLIRLQSKSDLTSQRYLDLPGVSNKQNTIGLTSSVSSTGEYMIYDAQKTYESEIKIALYIGKDSFELAHVTELRSQVLGTSGDLKFIKELNMLVFLIYTEINLYTADTLELISSHRSSTVTMPYVSMLSESYLIQPIEDSMFRLHLSFTLKSAVLIETSVIEIDTLAVRSLDALPVPTPLNPKKLQLISSEIVGEGEALSFEYAETLENRVSFKNLVVTVFNQLTMKSFECSEEFCPKSVKGKELKVLLNFDVDLLEGSATLSLKEGVNTPIYSLSEETFFLEFPIKITALKKASSSIAGAKYFTFWTSYISASAFEIIRSTLLLALLPSQKILAFAADRILGDLTFFYILSGNDNLSVTQSTVENAALAKLLPGNHLVPASPTTSSESTPFTKLAFKLSRHFLDLAIILIVGVLISSIANLMLKRVKPSENPQLKQTLLEWFRLNFGLTYWMAKLQAISLEMISLSLMTLRSHSQSSVIALVYAVITLVFYGFYFDILLYKWIPKVQIKILIKQTAQKSVYEETIMGNQEAFTMIKSGISEQPGSRNNEFQEDLSQRRSRALSSSSEDDQDHSKSSQTPKSKPSTEETLNFIQLLRNLSLALGLVSLHNYKSALVFFSSTVIVAHTAIYCTIVFGRSKSVRWHIFEISGQIIMSLVYTTKILYDYRLITAVSVTGLMLMVACLMAAYLFVVLVRSIATTHTGYARHVKAVRDHKIAVYRARVAYEPFCCVVPECETTKIKEFDDDFPMKAPKNLEAARRRAFGLKPMAALSKYLPQKALPESPDDLKEAISATTATSPQDSQGKRKESKDHKDSSESLDEQHEIQDKKNVTKNLKLAIKNKIWLNALKSKVMVGKVRNPYQTVVSTAFCSLRNM